MTEDKFGFVMRVEEGEEPPNTSVRPHINPKFSPKRSGRVHINPNFSRREGGPVGKNSKVDPQYTTTTGAPPLPLPPQAGPPLPHLNPKFAHRPLPSLPSLPSLTSRPDKPARSSRPRPASYYSTDHRQTTDRQTDYRQEPVYASLRRPPPSLQLDSVKQAEYEASIRRTVAASVSANPRLQPPPSKPARPSLQAHEQTASSRTASDPSSTAKLSPCEKENVPSSTATVKTKSNIFTPLRNSAAFKKFGSRKLVRVKTPTSTPTTSFKKIGSKKLIRISEKNVPSTSKDKTSPSYDIKTKTKIVKSVKDTPSNRTKYRFSFITPLSNRKSRYPQNSVEKKSNSGRKSLSSFRSRFKLDRRSKSKSDPKVLFKTSSQTRLKRLSGGTYKVSATKLQKVVPAPSKPNRNNKYKVKPRAVNPSLAASKVITVQGIKFAVGDNGRKLKRLPSIKDVVATPATSYSASVSHTTTPPGLCFSSSPQDASKQSPDVEKLGPPRPRVGSQAKVYLGGEEFDEVEPGVFTRSRHSLTRQSITEAKNRSINIILKNQNRSKQYCMFYNKFGKCTKKEKGSCPFLHDQDKVAVCRRFLQGACVKEACLLSHRVAPEKMPTCKFFLEGLCTKDHCPYLHVKVNPKADICEAFLKGYCPNGSDCRQRHVMACPEFDRTGVCAMVGRCPFPHVEKVSQRTPQSEKRIAPAKPKRKSLGKTPDCSKKSKVAVARYYEDGLNNTKEPLGAESGRNIVGDEDITNKRKIILQKIELVKQGWPGVTVIPAESVSGESSGRQPCDDSGHYERIDSGTDSDDGKEASGEGKSSEKAPMGVLGDFISLAGYSSEEEEVPASEHRLI